MSPTETMGVQLVRSLCGNNNHIIFFTLRVVGNNDFVLLAARLLMDVGGKVEHCRQAVCGVAERQAPKSLNDNGQLICTFRCTEILSSPRIERKDLSTAELTDKQIVTVLAGVVR
jgi:hypothetical protein